MAQHEIAGERRTALNFVLMSILARAKGLPPQQVSNANLLDRFPIIAKAQVAQRIDSAEATALVAEIVGNETAAREILQAHKRAGFGAEAYNKLGI